MEASLHDRVKEKIIEARSFLPFHIIVRVAIRGILNRLPTDTKDWSEIYWRVIQCKGKFSDESGPGKALLEAKKLIEENAEKYQ